MLRPPSIDLHADILQGKKEVSKQRGRRRRNLRIRKVWEHLDQKDYSKAR